MSQFIKKLTEIKKDTFDLNDFYIQELVELFNFQNKKDKDFILGNNEESHFNQGDIYHLLQALLDEEKLKNYEDEIVENYKSKYLDKNSFITKAYCLVYLNLFIKYYKIKDYKPLFRQLYNYSYNDVIERFIIIFREIKDEEYFVKSFNVFLGQETMYGNKNLSKKNTDFLFNLPDENFIIFLNTITNEGLLYLKNFDLKDSKIFIEKIKLLGNSEINNKLRSQLLGIIQRLIKKEKNSYNVKKIYIQFIKSDFCKLLTEYLGKIFSELTLDILDEILDLFLGYWEIIILISNILNKDNIKSIIEKSGKKFYDVYIYENIEGGVRKNKKKLLEEFQKYEQFNQKLKKRKKIIEKDSLKWENKEKKEKEKFIFGINEIIDELQKDSTLINEYLLYHFYENTYQLQENKEIKAVVKNQVKRFFKLKESNPEIYELHYTKKDKNGSSYRTHQFVVNHTFLICLKFYKQFRFKITKDIIKKTIRYLPFAYEDSLEDIFSIIGNSEVEKDDIDYLLSIYDGTRGIDDLKYHNILSFIRFYEKYKGSFIKYGKTEIQSVFINIINDEEFQGYEKECAAEKLSEIGEEKQLLILFNKYKSDESYFSNIEKFTPTVMFGKSLIKRFPNGVERNKIIDWFINQLKQAKISIPIIDYGEGMRGISSVESELSWDLKDEKNFISVFKYIDDLDFENDIKELLKYSFDIIEESKKDYKIFGNYIQQAVFNFYEGIKIKSLKKIFELEKQIRESLKDDEVRILFQINFLDKLVYIYSENVDKGEIHKIYKSVYNVKKEDSQENERLKEELLFLKNEKNKLEKSLKLEKRKRKKIENDMKKYSNNKKEDPVILFVEGKTDKRYLEFAYKSLFGKDFPYKIEMLYGKLQLRNYINDIELLNYTYPEYRLFIALFDFDSAYKEFNGLDKFKDYSRKVNKYIKKDDNNFRYAFLLPANTIHSDIKKNLYIDGDETKDHFSHTSEFEIEHLFYGVNQKIDSCFEDKNVVGGGKLKILKKEYQKDKVLFSQMLLAEYHQLKIKQMFDNFKPIFEIIDEIFEDYKKNIKK